MNLSIREKSDEGMPIVLAEPEGEIAAQYRTIADALEKALNKGKLG